MKKIILEGTSMATTNAMMLAFSLLQSVTPTPAGFAISHASISFMVSKSSVYFACGFI